MASRLDAPVLGAFDELSSGDEKWQANISWRYQKSDRHFRGTTEETNREAEHSEVINEVNLAELSLRYNFSSRNSITVGSPFLMATRSHPIRDANRDVVDRSVLNSRGLSDITVVGRRLMLEPTPERRGNVTLGVGVKLPTGANNVVDTLLEIARETARATDPVGHRAQHVRQFLGAHHDQSDHGDQ